MTCVALDLFCGVGGLSKGLELAGIKVAAGIDIDDTCKFAYEANIKAQFIHQDVKKITTEEIMHFYPANSIRVLVGCAPCQPFSKYSRRYRKNGQIDDKWSLLNSFADIVRESLPHIISMENVSELSQNGIFFDFLETLYKLGYNVEWRVVYCPEYGIPQNRKRLVLLASQLGHITLIPPTCNEEDFPTVRDAIGKLPPISAGEESKQDSIHKACKLSEINLRRIRSSVPGGTWRDWDESLKLSCHKKQSGKTYPAVYGRMSWDAPAPTITTQFYGYGNGRFGHPDQDRALSLREGAILQSFPADYIFSDEIHPISKKKLGIQIGNAVPVELGRAIGISILNHIQEVGLDG